MFSHDTIFSAKAVACATVGGFFITTLAYFSPAQLSKHEAAAEALRTATAAEATLAINKNPSNVTIISQAGQGTLNNVSNFGTQNNSFGGPQFNVGTGSGSGPAPFLASQKAPDQEATADSVDSPEQSMASPDPASAIQPVNATAPQQENNSYGGNQYNLQNSTLYNDPGRVSSKDASVLLGNWIGSYECGHAEGQLTWTISYVAGHLQIAEVSHRDLGGAVKFLHKSIQTTTTYKAIWDNPNLQIESTSNFKYTATLTLSPLANTLSGRYSSHLCCSTISLRKTV